MIMQKLLLPFGLALGLLAGTAHATGAPAAFKAGINYIPVVPAQPTSVPPGQIQVVEFFWYGCARCFALQPYLEAWDKNKPANVVLKRVPAALNPQWDIAARAYYTARQLGIPAQTNDAIYQALQIKHMNLATAADYENFFTSRFGVTAQQFETVWNSLEVDARISQAKVLAQRYGITDVPTLAVNGKWLTGAGYHLSNAQIMAAVNWLVQQEQTALTGGAQ